MEHPVGGFEILPTLVETLSSTPCTLCMLVFFKLAIFFFVSVYLMSFICSFLSPREYHFPEYKNILFEKLYD